MKPSFTEGKVSRYPPHWREREVSSTLRDFALERLNCCLFEKIIDHTAFILSVKFCLCYDFTGKARCLLIRFDFEGAAVEQMFIEYSGCKALS